MAGATGDWVGVAGDKGGLVLAIRHQVLYGKECGWVVIDSELGYMS